MRIFSSLLNHNPLVRFLKNVRNSIVDHFFRYQRQDTSEFVRHLNTVAPKRICFCVAFNTPWCIEMMILAWNKNISGVTIAIVDNSNCPQFQEKIRVICSARNVPYVRLPKNPEWSPNRSHALAMNWIVYNVVPELECEFFGFLDHDCFPLRKFDLVAHLSNVNAYGLRRLSSNGHASWNLWAGFCFFRTLIAKSAKLDFKHRVEFGLDTGGSNWPRLYKHTRPEEVRFADETSSDFPGLPVTGKYHIIEKVFIHVGGASYRDIGDKSEMQRRLFEVLDSPQSFDHRSVDSQGGL